jgi:hypothetical protein
MLALEVNISFCSFPTFQKNNLDAIYFVLNSCNPSKTAAFKSNYFPRGKSFKFTLFLTALTTMQCMEGGSI